MRGDLLAHLLVATTPGGIEAQEASEQRRAVASQRLPINGTEGRRSEWEAMGFVFGDAADDLFVNVTFPAGWNLEPTEHSMWSNLLDDKGRKRAAMFYKGAFYDRSAHITLSRRFSLSGYHGTNKPYSVVAMDGDSVIYTAGTWGDKDWEEQTRLDRLAEAWLTEKYPDWKNEVAYWND